MAQDIFGEKLVQRREVEKLKDSPAQLCEWAAQITSTLRASLVKPRATAIVCDRLLLKPLHMNDHKQSAVWAATKVRIAIILGGSLVLGLAPAGFAQTIWQAQSGDWFQPVNWSDGVPTRAC
ncbi:MAG: hypothetical protein H0W43_09535 [Chthoniobacterales bacterium]|nr:hypothetical protein [Chthoniobacterales bacterium]